MSMQGQDSGGHDGDSVRVGEYVLGLLDAPEHERMRRRIAAEPALAAELQVWQSRFAELDTEFAEATPPADGLARLETRLFGARSSRWSSLWASLPLWRGLAAGAVAIAAVAVGFALVQPPRLDPREFADQMVAALEAQEGFGVEFVALYNAATGEVRLAALSGEPIPDKDYELWYIHADEPAVSMGVIPVDQRSEIELDPAAKAKFEPGTVLAVTLEQKGGSPTGVAQGPVVAVGTATPI